MEFESKRLQKLKIEGRKPFIIKELEQTELQLLEARAEEAQQVYNIKIAPEGRRVDELAKGEILLGKIYDLERRKTELERELKELETPSDQK